MNYRTLILTLFGAAVFIGLAAAPSYAQRGGGTSGLGGGSTMGGPGGRTNTPNNPTVVAAPKGDNAQIKSIEGKIVSVKAEDGVLTIESAPGKQLDFKIDAKKTKYKADKKTELASKKNLGLTDFQTGETVSITYYLATNVATEVRLKPTKE